MLIYMKLEHDFTVYVFLSQDKNGKTNDRAICAAFGQPNYVKQVERDFSVEFGV